MTLAELGELGLLKKIRAGFGGGVPGPQPGVSKGVLKGIGDDAAVLRLKRGCPSTLATVDMMQEGVHFDLRFITPSQLGFKLVSVNASDIYAMGGSPDHALLAMALPASLPLAFLKDFLSGLARGLSLYDMSLVGGDLSGTTGPLSLSLTVLGHPAKRGAVLRSGAQPGDAIYVTGTLGDSALGLHLLKRLERPVDFKSPINKPLPWRVMEPLLRRHLLPEARKPGAWLRHATSMMDISDGLFIDLGRLCAEGGGLGARIDAEAIPMSGEFREAARRLELDPLKMATEGGEDYELLFTAPAGVRVRGASRVGEIISRGFIIEGQGRKPRAFRPRGYSHFRK